ncbi:DNA starvation/stationary phase protection protein [Nocardioides guangzhouensis]|uniref:DNA starvation/stationary phase protection protein n=1 Tax=Nocardioides guangzhouensis TaxID=2497878 RepID=A0A4Q4ZB31_9ACTN|nr:DNA starvation/stationary phase protection protein [Nocardioides guangzhouensis]RYP84446.1 DNA starvation/stationary phase protection protein [Nocardioides guangzhouensis]
MTTRLDTRPDIHRVEADLQDTLVELTDLAMQAKQAHWNVTGPRFLPLHAQLDKLATGLRTAADEVAERAAALGYAPDGRSDTVARESPLLVIPAGALTDQGVVKIMVRALDVVAKRVSMRVQHLEQLDPVSQDLLITVAHDLEKQRWLFDAQQS